MLHQSLTKILAGRQSKRKMIKRIIKMEKHRKTKEKKYKMKKPNKNRKTRKTQKYLLITLCDPLGVHMSQTNCIIHSEHEQDAN